ncbi:MAG: hypothetical protein ACKVT1_04470 [Dehalococcoidia bacterium]
MQLDWDKAINEILSDQMVCQGCGALGEEMVVGYTRSVEAAAFADRCKDCVDKTDCDARKLVVVCEACAALYRVNGSKVDEAGMMAIILTECRHNLEESIDYLTSYWKEDAEVDYEEMQKGLHEVDPELFKEEDSWRMRLEEEYLQLHRWFREHQKPIPDAGWRSQYAEDVIGMGYTTLLGD